MTFPTMSLLAHTYTHLDRHNTHRGKTKERRCRQLIGGDIKGKRGNEQQVKTIARGNVIHAIRADPKRRDVSPPLILSPRGSITPGPDTNF